MCSFGLFERFSTPSAPLRDFSEGAESHRNDCLLRHYLWSLICTRQWPLLFTWTHCLIWNLTGTQSNKPVQYVVATTDKLSFSSRLYNTSPLWKSTELWCSNTFSFTDMFKFLLDEIMLISIWHCVLNYRGTLKVDQRKNHNILAFLWR